MNRSCFSAYFKNKCTPKMILQETAKRLCIFSHKNLFILCSRMILFFFFFFVATSPCVIYNVDGYLCIVPAKALEILSFFHSQGWSYSSGGRSSSWGSRLSLGQRERSGSESPPFSAGSYGVSYRGSCLPGPSLGPRPPDRISTNKEKDWSLMLGFCNKTL